MTPLLPVDSGCGALPVTLRGPEQMMVPGCPDPTHSPAQGT